jgi:light-regulated signal transduction histidine kinase (bacteriophytochrome)
MCAAAATQTYRFKRTEMLAKFLEQIAAVGDFASGLTQGQPNLLSFVESTGAVVLFDEICMSVGNVPNDAFLSARGDQHGHMGREPKQTGFRQGWACKA